MDDKKKESKPLEIEILVIIFVAIFLVAGTSIAAALSPVEVSLQTYQPYFDQAAWWIKEVAGILVVISVPLSLIFLLGIVYCVRRLAQIREKERLMYDVPVEQAYEPASPADQRLATQWENIKRQIASSNENDWKQAIIGADLILDDILTKMGYQGDSIGDKLKRVEPGDMKTLSDAWEAHKVRNAIAHEAGFKLNQHEANHTINRYKRVFEEFYYI